MVGAVEGSSGNSIHTRGRKAKQYVLEYDKVLVHFDVVVMYSVVNE